MRPRFPVEVVVKDPHARDAESGRPTLVFLVLSSEDDLLSLERDVEAGKYVVLNEISPAALVDDIARSRRKRRKKAVPPLAPADQALSATETPEDDEYEDVLGEDEDEDEDGNEAAAAERAVPTPPEEYPGPDEPIQETSGT